MHVLINFDGAVYHVQHAVTRLSDAMRTGIAPGGGKLVHAYLLHTDNVRISVHNDMPPRRFLPSTDGFKGHNDPIQQTIVRLGLERRQYHRHLNTTRNDVGISQIKLLHTTPAEQRTGIM